MGNFFTSLFSSSKPAEATEDKAKNEQKNVDILKYDGVRDPEDRVKLGLCDQMRLRRH